ncbi:MULTISPECIES: hypothetical protein [Candidatus Accumulibacter]|uniref:Uncharacterized protein n=2 Tax=Candidatus Accumulibacter TaxID=327159 RepID=A0A080M5T7_9PROT|nr:MULTISPECIES: hypothetical protein [Candidatus Accumulibacter]KFB76647.1 MAG: hypothetical protein AW06_002287 [Candidatus Accumulibacter cognatus]MBL8402483.1 hypothetical protein [Accumulibacter sp.]TMQ76914.1 hypothetical protein ACCUM_3787 [Candidatus Accumulibacter phosphatis]
MNVVVLINGREAIPVRAIPYVTGRWMSPDVVAKSLAYTDSMNRFEGIYAYQLLADGGYSQVLPGDWDVVDDLLQGLESSLNALSDDRKLTRPVWLTESTKQLPAGVFLWRDEFEQAFHRNYSPPRFSLLDERPGDLTLRFSPLISPPEMRGVVMEGFEDSADDLLVGKIRNDQTRLLLSAGDDAATDRFAQRYFEDGFNKVTREKAGERNFEAKVAAVNLTDERCIELAHSHELRIADWTALTGIGIGVHWSYVVSAEGVAFRKWTEGEISEASVDRQIEMHQDNEAVPLRFPCAPAKLLQFIDAAPPGSHRFSIPDVFRQAVTEQAPMTDTPARVPAELQGQSDITHSGAPEKAAPVVTPDDDEQGEAATTAQEQKADATQSTRRIPEQRRQEQEILQVLCELGYSADALPKWVSGKPGVKAEVRGRFASWQGTVFDKAWDRLRADKRIRDAD